MGLVEAPIRQQQDVPDDQELIAQSIRGDQYAFEQIYRRYVSRVYTFLKWNTADEHEAEELTQEVFIRAWQRLDQFKGASGLATWLTSIAINAWRSRRRVLRRRALDLGGSMREFTVGDAQTRVYLESAALARARGSDDEDSARIVLRTRAD